MSKHKKYLVHTPAWDEPIYDYRDICNGCSTEFDNTEQWDQHSIDGCPYGYTVTEVPSGGHYEAKWFQQVAMFVVGVVLLNK